ncbi:hypothetical protein HYU92_06960 [Candidatus Curtissbacteria bacterium]|nr:hypothetical protein [Candidatus Curtissbacteria bacterium]
MAHRAKSSQVLHDRKVQQIAIRHLRVGHQVLVDLPGHRRPSAIDGYIPDIVVKDKGKITRIIEVETPATVRKDFAKNKVFSQEAKRLKATFLRYVARPKAS